MIIGRMRADSMSWPKAGIFAVVATLSMGLPGIAYAVATTWYVSPSGTGTSCVRDGRSPESAFRSIQFAIGCSANGDSIRLAAGTYTETVSVTKNLSIIGAGKTTSVIRSPADSTTRVVTTAATVSIAKVRITGGHAGGLLNSGTLTLSTATVSGNDNAVDLDRLFGGGIHNAGTLTVKGSTINNNRPNVFWGGGIYNSGSLRVVNSQVNGNSAIDGGGIFTEGPASITGSTIAVNDGDDGVGGLANYYTGGTVTVSSTRISGNVGEFFGGIDQRGSRMVIKNSQVLDNVSENANAGGIANFSSNGTLLLQGSTVRGNQTGDLGGGIWVAGGSVGLTSSSLVTMNTAQDGGGIYNSGGTVSISADSAVTNNVPNDCVNC